MTERIILQSSFERHVGPELATSLRTPFLLSKAFFRQRCLKSCGKIHNVILGLLLHLRQSDVIRIVIFGRSPC